MSIYVRKSDSEPIQLDVKDITGQPLLGATGVLVRIRRDSDGFWLDWDDNVYKAGPWIERDKLAFPVDPTLAPGIYVIGGGYPTASISNAVDDDHYLAFTVNSGAADTALAVLPPPMEFRVGFWADAIGLDCVLSATIGSLNPDTIKFIAWLERQNKTVTSGLISATIEFRDADGAIEIASTAMTGPDAQGVFKLDVPSIALTINSNFYAIVTVTDMQGAVVAYTATPTVG